jgi:hypothetical protein
MRRNSMDDEFSPTYSPKPTRKNSKRTSGVPDLFRAIERDDVEIMLTLMEDYAVDVHQLLPFKFDETNDISWGCLHAAAYFNARKCLDELMAAGGDIEQKDGWLGSRPLGWAAYGGHIRLCKHIISKYRAVKTAQNNTGNTAWSLVIDQNNSRWIDVFLDRDAWLQNCHQLGLQPIYPEEPTTPIVAALSTGPHNDWFLRTEDLKLPNDARLMRDSDFAKPEVATLHTRDDFSSDSNAPGLQETVGDAIIKLSQQVKPAIERPRTRLIGDVCLYNEERTWQRDIYPMDPIRGRSIAVPAGVGNVQLRVYPFERSPFDHSVVYPMYRECKVRINRGEVIPHQKVDDAADRPTMNPEGISLDKTCYHVNVQNLTSGHNVIEIVVSDRILVKIGHEWHVYWTRDFYHVNLLVASGWNGQEKLFQVEPFMYEWAQGKLSKEKAAAMWAAQAQAIGWPLDRASGH